MLKGVHTLYLNECKLCIKRSENFVFKGEHTVFKGEHTLYLKESTICV